MPMLRRGYGAARNLRCKSGARFPPSTVVVVVVVVVVVAAAAAVYATVFCACDGLQMLFLKSRFKMTVAQWGAGGRVANYLVRQTFKHFASSEQKM